MTNLINKYGNLNIKTDKKGNLILFRNEKCDDFYKYKKGRDCKAERERENIKSEHIYINEINKYLPERKGTKKYYWGMTPKQNMKKLQQEAEGNCECLTIAKVPKEKVSVGNYEVADYLVDPSFTEKEKKEMVKNNYYDLIPYTELEKLTPSQRKQRYGDGLFEFLVK